MIRVLLMFSSDLRTTDTDADPPALRRGAVALVPVVDDGLLRRVSELALRHLVYSPAVVVPAKFVRPVDVGYLRSDLELGGRAAPGGCLCLF